MILYHCSDVPNLSTLNPAPHTQNGPSPCVWLTNDYTSGKAHGTTGKQATYQYEVEIDFKDPDLYLDQGFQAFCVQDRPLPPILLLWFLCTRPIAVRHVYTWDASQKAYV